MSPDLLWAGLALLALLGWAATLVLIARALLPMANAFKVLHVVDKTFDERINAVLDRARAKVAKPAVPPPGQSQSQPNAAQDVLRDMFGPGPLISPSMGLDEQPDSNLEIVDA